MDLISNIVIVVGVVATVWWVVETVLYIRNRRKIRIREKEIDQAWDAHWNSVGESIKTMGFTDADRERRRKEDRERMKEGSE